MPHLFESQPIEIERFYTGVISQRNPLAIPIRIMGRRIIELYDAILAGSNCEISVRSTLVRRAGYAQANTSVVTGLGRKWFAFEPVAQNGKIYTLLDTTTNIWQMPIGLPSTGGPSNVLPTNLFTKPGTAQSSFFAVGNYLYIGNTSFSKKWDSGTPQGLTNWGIAIGSLNNAVGPNTAGSGINAPGSGTPWVSPGNVSSAVFFASVTLNTNNNAVQSLFLQAGTFGFVIPSTNTVTGIQVNFDLNASALTGTGTFIQTIAFCFLSVNGVRIGNLRSAPITPGGGTIATVVGGPGDTWGVNLTPAILNDPTFAFNIYAFLDSSGGTAQVTDQIRNVQTTIFGTGGPSVSLVAGTLTATQGFQYLFCYSNSNDGNISNPSPASASIKPVAQGVQINLTASADPQVTNIRVFRTTDTGTGAVFFELPTSPYPNVTGNVVDNAPDILLQVTQSLSVGSLAFSPPPSGLRLMAWYAGRMWGAVGNLLYFSAGPDNFPMGNGNSDWPPANVFELPKNIVKLIPLAGGNGMLVVTIDAIHIVQGITNPGFTVNMWNPDIGARQENAVDSDGSTIYVFTSDRQLLQISAAGINELSQYISDVTDTFDPTVVSVRQHRSGSQDSRVFLSNGSTQVLPYNLMSGAWEPAQTPGDGQGFLAIDSIEVLPGQYRLMRASNAQTLGFTVASSRDLNTFTDNSAQYSWNVTFGNIPIADPTQLANVDSMVLRMTNAGNLPNFVGILPNDISGSFIQINATSSEPPEASTPVTGHRAQRYSMATGNNLWQQMMHLQLKFTFANSAAQEEILSWGLFPNESADQPTGQIPQVQGR